MEAVSTVVAAVTTVDVAVVVASTSTVEAMAAPAVAVAPVGPGAYAEEDAVVEVAGPVVAIRGTGVGVVVIVAPGADGGRAADGYSNLRAADGDADTNLRTSRRWRKCQTS